MVAGGFRRMCIKVACIVRSKQYTRVYMCMNVGPSNASSTWRASFLCVCYVARVRQFIGWTIYSDIIYNICTKVWECIEWRAPYVCNAAVAANIITYYIYATHRTRSDLNVLQAKKERQKESETWKGHFLCVAFAKRANERTCRFPFVVCRT